MNVNITKIMNNLEIITKCPQCLQIINTSNSRLVKELCGHIKCRNCLLKDTEACSICLNIRINQNEIEPITVLLSPNTHCKVKTEWAKLASESFQRVEREQNTETVDSYNDDEDNTFSDKLEIDTDSEIKINEITDTGKIKIIENIVIAPDETNQTKPMEITEKKKNKIRLKDKMVSKFCLNYP